MWRKKSKAPADKSPVRVLQLIEGGQDSECAFGKRANARLREGMEL
ncbi:hypothetical protein G3M81_18800 [Bacillus paralicheniformis]|nr:hypothetical protein [Bacillus paralicheniformis]QII50654.1 hypothetical protein G3M81_18800 [Bacillus paralicheniformis]